jgi:uncharacterized protein YbjT (DUF2867 family)
MDHGLLPSRVMSTTGRKIAVAGATGRVGRHLVDLLRARGCDTVRISRADGVDLVSGAGLAEALAGVDCVVDAASGPSSEEAATSFFTTVARNLHDVGTQAGVRSIVVVSIIGCDRFSAGYYAAKQAHERAMLAGPIPVRLLRAAQFHELVAELLERGRRDGVSYVRKMRTQPVAARVAAEALADMATASGAQTSPSSIPEIAGPRAENMAELARLLAARRGEAIDVEEVSDPGNPDRELYEGAGLLPSPHATLAGPSFAEWLDELFDQVQRTTR